MKPKDATIEMETLHEYTPSGTVCVITEESSFSWTEKKIALELTRQSWSWSHAA